MLDKKLISMLAFMLVIAVAFTKLDIAFYLLFVEPLLAVVLFVMVGVNRVSVGVVSGLFILGVFYILTSSHRLGRVLEMFS